MKIVVTGIFILYINLLKFADSRLNVDDFCTLRKHNEIGICQLLDNCPPAARLLQTRGILPQTCSFTDNKPIVCCEFKNVKNTVLNMKPVSRSLQSLTDKAVGKPKKLQVGDISRKKCKEYERYAYFYPIPEGPPVDGCGASPVHFIKTLNLVQGEFPHMALIGYEDINQTVWQCSGSLISEEFVLTAAHCFSHIVYGDPKYVRLGDLDLNVKFGKGSSQDFTIAEKYIHPTFRQHQLYNDIALIKLNKKAMLGIHVKPACLETSELVDLSKENLVATDMGSTDFADENIIVMKATIQFASYSECNHAYRPNNGRRLRYGIKNDTQFCVGSNEKDIMCQFSTGGPIQRKNEDHYCMYNIVGISSFGKHCSVPNAPSVYTKVANYVEWIERIVWL